MWPQSTYGVSRSVLRNLFFLLLVVMVGRGMMLPLRLLLETQTSHIQSLFKFSRIHNQILLMMNHSDWWLHSQCPKRLAVLFLHWQRLVGQWWGTFYLMWWIDLLWICLHLLHFLNYFHFLKLFQLLYLLLHYLPYRLHVLHCHSVVPL